MNRPTAACAQIGNHGETVRVVSSVVAATVAAVFKVLSAVAVYVQLGASDNFAGDLSVHEPTVTAFRRTSCEQSVDPEAYPEDAFRHTHSCRALRKT